MDPGEEAPGVSTLAGGTECCEEGGHYLLMMPPLSSISSSISANGLVGQTGALEAALVSTGTTEREDSPGGDAYRIESASSKHVCLSASP